MKKNPHAVALGKRNKGRKKVLSPEESQRRRNALHMARSQRWSGKNTTAGPEPELTDAGQTCVADATIPNSKVLKTTGDGVSQFVKGGKKVS